MDGQCIDVVSTSATTADATPVVLSETERMRFRFVPTIVNNQSSPECTVRGKILFERKPQNDKFFPTDTVAPCERITRGNFFYICEYFNITPQEFFNFGEEPSNGMDALIDQLKQFDAEQINALTAFIKTIVKK